MSQILRGLKSTLKGSVELPEAGAEILSGLTGLASPILDQGSKFIHLLGKVFGGGSNKGNKARRKSIGRISKPRRSQRLANLAPVNYSPSRKKK